MTEVNLTSLNGVAWNQSINVTYQRVAARGRVTYERVHIVRHTETQLLIICLGEVVCGHKLCSKLVKFNAIFFNDVAAWKNVALLQ